MRRREFITLLGGTSVAWPLPLRAQQRVKSIQEIPIAPGISTFPSSSAGVFDSSGALVRTLWSAVPNPNPNTANPAATWDGTLDDGTVAATGTYAVKLLQHACTYTWEGVVGNSSPDHTTFTYHNEGAVILDMEVTPAGEMYYCTGYSERWPVSNVTTTADPQNMDYVQAYGSRASYTAQWRCASDGVIAYYAWITSPTFSMVYGVSCTSFSVMPGGGLFRSYINFPTGTPPGGGNPVPSAIAIDTTPTGNFIHGVAVQKGAGSFLFITRGFANTLITADKTSGATLQTNLTYTNPQAIATSPTTGNLWMAYGASLTTVAEFRADAFGNLTPTGVAITGLQSALAVAVSPSGSRVLVADGGSSQQIKAFVASTGAVDTSWAVRGTLGDAGGYANGAAISNTRYLFLCNCGFEQGVGVGCYIAYVPADGSFWFGDPGNRRSLHFSAGNSPSFIEHIAYIPGFYSNNVCKNDPTRVFAGFVEYKIDYTKPLAANNGSWTYANNWSYGVDSINVQNDPYTNFRWAGTYSNGRTYATLRNSGTGLHKVYELTSAGPRDTGKAIYQYAQVDNGFNLWFMEFKTAGQVAHLYKNTFTGFDGSNNPTWKTNPSLVPTGLQMTTQTLPALFPPTSSSDANLVFPFAKTASGVVPTYDFNGTNFSNNHFGGIDFATGKVKFSTHPITQSTNIGNPSIANLLFAPVPFFSTGSGGNPNAGGASLLIDGMTDIFTEYNGEEFGANQTNMWSHWHESGLLVNRFGVAAPYFGARVAVTPAPQKVHNNILFPNGSTDFKSLYGMAGNATRGGITFVANSYYLYQNDEWYHCGLHRWRIDNASSIRISSQTVSWNSSSYVPFSDPTDMLAGLTFNTRNLPDNTASWHRSPASDIGSFTGGTPWWQVLTSTVNPDNLRQSRDICIGANAAGVSYFVQRPLVRSGSGDWTVSMLVMTAFNEFMGAFNTPTDYSLLFLDILDGSGNRIVRMNQFPQSGALLGSFQVNGVNINTPMVINNDWQYYCGQLQPLTIQSNIAGGTTKVTFGISPTTVTTGQTATFSSYTSTQGVYDVGAAMATPAMLKITYESPLTAAPAGIVISKFNFF